MGELCEALVIEVGETDYNDENIDRPNEIIDACQGLVVHDEQTDVVRFAHKVQAYLKDHCSSNINLLAIFRWLV